MPNHELQLFMTEQCHLCECAKQALDTLGLSYKCFDIMNINDALEHYGHRIPVVQRSDGDEMDWPFSLLDLVAFLHNRESH